MSFTKTIIRCAVDVTSKDPIKDTFTGAAPSIWNSTDVEFQFAFFKGSGSNAALLDMTVFESITGHCKPKTRLGNDYFSRTIDEAAINKDLTAEQWSNGTGEHLKMSFTADETNLPLNGALEVDFWFVLSAITSGLPKATDTLGGTTLTSVEDGVATDGGALMGGNSIPEGATYNAMGQYDLAVVQDRVYKWTKGGVNDADLVNGAQIVATTDTNFVTQGNSITLRGAANQLVTAVVRGGVFLTADESDARYVLKNGDTRAVCIDDGNTYRLTLRIVDNLPVETWQQVSGGAQNPIILVCTDDGNSYGLVLRLVDGIPASTFVITS